MTNKNKDLKSILIIDLKTNTWEKKNPQGSYNEIIKLSVSDLNINEEKIISTQSFIIKPKQKEICEKTLEVHNITKEEIENGFSFLDVCRILEQNYCSGIKTWAAYGNFAKILIQKQCKYEGIYSPMSNDFINIKNYFAVSKKLNTEVKLNKAIDMFGLQINEYIKDESYQSAFLLANLLGFKKFQLF